MSQATLIVIIATILVYCASFSFGGLPNTKCIQNYPEGTGPCGPNNEGCRFNDPNNIFTLACDDDCKVNHVSKYGQCDGEGICNCGPNQLDVIASNSVQCLDYKKAGLYNKICEIDCQCAHQTRMGICNYHNKACFCRGRLYRKSVCPYPNGNEFFLATLRLYNEIGNKPYEKDEEGGGGQSGQEHKPYGLKTSEFKSFY